MRFRQASNGLSPEVPQVACQERAERPSMKPRGRSLRKSRNPERLRLDRFHRLPTAPSWHGVVCYKAQELILSKIWPAVAYPATARALTLLCSHSTIRITYQLFMSSTFYYTTATVIPSAAAANITFLNTRIQIVNSNHEASI